MNDFVELTPPPERATGGRLVLCLRYEGEGYLMHLSEALQVIEGMVARGFSAHIGAYSKPASYTMPYVVTFRSVNPMTPQEIGSTL